MIVLVQTNSKSHSFSGLNDLTVESRVIFPYQIKEHKHNIKNKHTKLSTNSLGRDLISVQELVRAFMHELFASA